MTRQFSLSPSLLACRGLAAAGRIELPPHRQHRLAIRRAGIGFLQGGIERGEPGPIQLGVNPRCAPQQRGRVGAGYPGRLDVPAIPLVAAGDQPAPLLQLVLHLDPHCRCRGDSIALLDHPVHPPPRPVLRRNADDVHSLPGDLPALRLVPIARLLSHPQLEAALRVHEAGALRVPGLIGPGRIGGRPPTGLSHPRGSQRRPSDERSRRSLR